jgi:hypothetical protein
LTNIAVFGDSFAARMHSEDSKLVKGFIQDLYKLCGRKYSEKEVTKLRKSLANKYTTWIDVIGADTYAYSGSDLYYSYNQFLKHHSKYDKCIFVITSPIRFSTNIDGWLHCASIDDAKEGVDFATDDKTKKIYTTLVDFFNTVYYKDLDRIELINQAMLDSIKQKRPDVVFIKAFNDLKQVFDLELKAWNMTFDESQDYTKYIDLRHCHMTNKNNEILGNYILDNITNLDKIDISTIEWHIPTVQEKEYHLVNTQDLFTWLL